MSDVLNLAVLGAGVVGFCTALELQNQFRNANISIIANQFYQNTTSFGAAGIFRPGTSFSGPNETITRRWINDSYYYWDKIRVTSEASNAGITEISGYIFSSTQPGIVKNHLIDKLVPIYRSATPDELKLCPGNWKYGSFFTTQLIECRLFLPWAQKKFVQSKGRIIERHIESFHDFSTENYDVVVNCTGLEARSLCNDFKLVPLRGQILKVHAPWLKTFFYADYDTYIIPGFNSVTLGGCRQYDSFNTDICRHDSAAIRERCEKLLPSLKDAPVLKEWVGLRPYRDTVRVEKENIKLPNGKNLRVVHNYGHGGYGVTTAPGTSIHAVDLVKESLIGQSKL